MTHNESKIRKCAEEIWQLSRMAQPHEIESILRKHGAFEELLNDGHACPKCGTQMSSWSKIKQPTTTESEVMPVPFDGTKAKLISPESSKSEQVGALNNPR